MKTISLSNIKGGVSKTTTASTLAAGLMVYMNLFNQRKKKHGLQLLNYVLISQHTQ